MDKKYILSFSISVIVLFTVGVIMLMLMTPQETQSVNTSVKDYDSINKTDYLYTQTKDISKDSLTKEYTVSPDDVSKFEQYKQYNPGNADPFTPKADVKTAEQNDTQQQAQEKTTNSNDGVANPQSTSK